MNRFIKVLLRCCFCICIVCFGNKAHATNEHNAKAEHFSMLELNRKLSAMILGKYPNSHIDGDNYYIDACNSVFNEDSTKQQQPCLDPRVKLRSDSKDFKLRLRLQSDFTHYRPIKNSAEVSSNSLTVIEKRYNIGELPNQEFSDHPKIDYVPLAAPLDWPYRAWQDLVQAGVTDPILSYNCISCTKPATRYEFAVGIARLLDQQEKRAKDSPQTKAVIVNLIFEFELEISELGVHIDHNRLVKELADTGIIWQPRYKYLQLDLSYGKKFDKKLRKQIEDTVADYTAAWMKSNSATSATTSQK